MYKKMKSKFFKIIFSIFLLFFVSTNRLIAQIIYTDIQDHTPNATFSLDINSDNIPDFSIAFAALNKIICIPLDNNAYSGNVINGEISPWALSQNTNICESLSTWYYANTTGIMAMGTSIGNWINTTNKYLPLKLIVGANAYFGWARFDVLPGSTTFIIKDYAYNSIPNSCIQAGQTSLNNFEISKKSNFKIFPNPFNSYTNIELNYDLDNAILNIYNSVGQMVRTYQNISSNKIKISKENLTNGLYFMELKQGNKVLGVEKLMVVE